MFSNYKLFFEQRNMNAPEFIYSIVYGKNPPPMRGRESGHEEKRVNGIMVDSAIPDKAVKDLLKIKGIETRSSCQGFNEERPTFLIFRPENQDPKAVRKLVENLNSYKDIKAGMNVGRQGQYRVGVATDLWAERDKKKFEKWWLELSKKIEESLVY